MKQPEYIEGPDALGNFKRLATAILQAPAKKRKKPRTSGPDPSVAQPFVPGLARIGAESVLPRKAEKK